MFSREYFLTIMVNTNFYDVITCLQTQFEDVILGFVDVITPDPPESLYTTGSSGVSPAAEIPEDLLELARFGCWYCSCGLLQQLQTLVNILARVQH